MMQDLNICRINNTATCTYIHTDWKLVLAYLFIVKTRCCKCCIQLRVPTRRGEARHSDSTPPLTSNRALLWIEKRQYLDLWTSLFWILCMQCMWLPWWAVSTCYLLHNLINVLSLISIRVMSTYITPPEIEFE